MLNTIKRTILFMACICILWFIYNTSCYAMDDIDEDAIITEIKNNENAQKLWTHIIDKGGTELWAAATIGNSFMESQLNSKLNSKNYYVGAFQIHNSVYSELSDYIYVNSYKVNSIVAQYEFLINEMRSGINDYGIDAAYLTGLSTSKMETDTTKITDFESAAAYFAFGIEGCTCYSGITSGEGKLNDKSWHSSDTCADYHFDSEFGTVCLQQLKIRTLYTELAYIAFHEDTEDLDDVSDIDEVLDFEVTIPDYILLPTPLRYSEDKSDNITTIDNIDLLPWKSENEELKPFLYPADEENELDKDKLVILDLNDF